MSHVIILFYSLLLQWLALISCGTKQPDMVIEQQQQFSHSWRSIAGSGLERSKGIDMEGGLRSRSRRRLDAMIMCIFEGAPQRCCLPSS